MLPPELKMVPKNKMFDHEEKPYELPAGVKGQ